MPFENYVNFEFADFWYFFVRGVNIQLPSENKVMQRKNLNGL